ncbi:TolB family protein [Hazenella coriacea]|uniref:Dipeptidyl peptidase IV (DPP IV)-like protein n=1 Tax=Hazenella coriacea TaxID=1179467 RepID=A0A4R3L966_9BACL|nr:DPP IV N-terminal domain-containing protein [Hazenella coriacea]TCS95758.1 dipeptidyl peptidase IV (DPP IV)-like protein [Hazenella coriacea]
MKAIYSIGTAVALTLSVVLPTSVTATPQTLKPTTSAQSQWEQHQMKAKVNKKVTKAIPQVKTKSVSSAQEKIVYSSYDEEDQGLFLVNPDGSNAVKIVDGWAVDGNISPDGSKIFFVGYSQGSDGDIFSVNVDGTGLTQITNTPESEDAPNLSPDGQKIVYSVYYNDSFSAEIFMMNIDGSGVEKLTNNPNQLKFHPVFSPDGLKILFDVTDRVTLDNDTYIMDYNGQNQINITNTPNHNEERPRWSPDGSLISFSVNQNVYVIKPDGSERKQVTHFKEEVELARVYSAVWSPDATKFVLTYHDGISLESPQSLNVVPVGGNENDFYSIANEGHKYASDWGFVN